MQARLLVQPRTSFAPFPWRYSFARLRMISSSWTYYKVAFSGIKPTRPLRSTMSPTQSQTDFPATQNYTSRRTLRPERSTVEVLADERTFSA
jgi:hypothetical protein